ncbi:hypothetical protein A3731_16055 [Roseovarius sp. HI0049]|nr:hypothetical protein A3731_16055 [Roseovarius sp. HI0049]
MALAEQLLGTIRTHTGYAVPKAQARGPASGRNRGLVPQIKGVQAAQLARAVAQGQRVTLGSDGLSEALVLPKEAAPLIGAVDGRRSLSEIATACRADPIGFGALWGTVEAKLAPWGMLLYSSVLR